MAGVEMGARERNRSEGRVVVVRNENARGRSSLARRKWLHFNPAIEINNHDAASDLVSNLREEFAIAEFMPTFALASHGGAKTPGGWGSSLATRVMAAVSSIRTSGARRYSHCTRRTAAERKVCGINVNPRGQEGA
jgi:hypothetical protein